MKSGLNNIYSYRGEEYNKKILYEMYNHKLRLGTKLYYYNDIVDINGNFIGQLFDTKIDDQYEDMVNVRTRKDKAGYGNIYKINNINNKKIYIGQTNDIYKRKNKHVFDLYSGSHSCTEMQIDFLLYGLNPFYFEVIETVEQKENMSPREKYWIQHFNSEYPNGYNAPSNRKEFSQMESKIFMKEYRNKSWYEQQVMLDGLKEKYGICVPKEDN
jgi:hypothetical protein